MDGKLDSTLRKWLSIIGVVTILLLTLATGGTAIYLIACAGDRIETHRPAWHQESAALLRQLLPNQRDGGSVTDTLQPASTAVPRKSYSDLMRDSMEHWMNPLNPAADEIHAKTINEILQANGVIDSLAESARKALNGFP